MGGLVLGLALHKEVLFLAAANHTGLALDPGLWGDHFRRGLHATIVHVETPTLDEPLCVGVGFACATSN